MVYATVHKDILNNCMIPTFWPQYGEGPFFFSSFIKTWFEQFALEYLGWPAQSPHLNLTEYLQGELDCQSRAMSSYLTSVPDHTNVLLAKWAHISTDTPQILMENLHRRVEDIITSQKWGAMP